MKLEVKNINKYYGAKQVLNDVSFSVNAGQTLGLLGRNGHGKSTTMKIIMGIIYSDGGEVLVDGQKLTQTKFKLGYLPEERGLYPKSTILEQMIYFARLRGLGSNEAKRSSLYLLEKLEMTEYINKKAATLSKGNQQKIQLAISLINEPDIIILDEPYSGLDPVNSKLLQEVVEENAAQNKVILFSSHQLNTVEAFCKDICIINNGQVLVSGTLSKIKSGYPKDKLLIKPEDGKQLMALHQLIHRELSDNVAESYLEETAVILKLRHESHKNKVIEQIMQAHIEVETFSLLYPTLLDIFLEKVGTDE